MADTARSQQISTTSTDRRVKGTWQALPFKGLRLLPHAAAAAATATSATWHGRQGASLCPSNSLCLPGLRLSDKPPSL